MRARRPGGRAAGKEVRPLTRQDFLYKWAVYGLALLPVWWLEVFVLNRFPVFGVSPMLLPLAGVAVAVLEGTLVGAGFGLAVGVLCDAVYFGTHGTMTLGLCLLCCACGAAAQYALNQGFWGCLLCSAAVLTLIDAGRILLRLFTGAASLPALLEVAAPEILWSLCFVAVLYPWFRWVRGRIARLLRL